MTITAALAGVPSACVAAWAWRLDALMDWAKAQQRERGQIHVAAFRRQFDEIYKSCNPYERQALRDAIDGDKIYKAFGVTPQALRDVDEWGRNDAYYNRIKDGAAALSKAVQDGASPEHVAAIVRDLADAQATNTRDEWDEQLTQSFADELKAVEEQPDTLKTKWEIGNVDKTGTFY